MSIYSWLTDSGESTETVPENSCQGTTPSKPPPRRMSISKSAPFLEAPLVKREKAHELPKEEEAGGYPNWSDLINLVKLSDWNYEDHEEKFTPIDDLPTMLWPGTTGLEMVGNSPKVKVIQGEILKAEQVVPAKEPPKGIMLDKSTSPLSPILAMQLLSTNQPSSASSYQTGSSQQRRNRASRSPSVSRGLGIISMDTRPIYEIAEEEGEDQDIVWPGPNLTSNNSPKTRSRNTSFSKLPNLMPSERPLPRATSVQEDRPSAALESLESFERSASTQDEKVLCGLESSPQAASKVKDIIIAIQKKDRVRLQQLGLDKLGFINNSLRSDAWCILLHSDKNHCKRSIVASRPHDSQIDKECTKAFSRFPSSLTGNKKRRKQKELSELLKAIFQREPKLSYYQGFRDIAACFLLVLGKRKVANAMQNAALFYFRDMMLETLGPVMRELAIGFWLVKLDDPELHSFLVASQAQSYYGLSWILTWFSHSSTSLSSTARIFDAFLSSDPIFPIYLMSAATMHRRDEILRLQCEKSEVHSFLSQFPVDIDVEILISRARDMYTKYSPTYIQEISRISLGKTTCTQRYEKDWNSIQTTEDYIRGYDSAQKLISQVFNSRKANTELKCGPLGCDIGSKPTTTTPSAVATPLLLKGIVLAVGALAMTYGLSIFALRDSRTFVSSSPPTAFEKTTTPLRPTDAVPRHSSGSNRLYPKVGPSNPQSPKHASPPTRSPAPQLYRDIYRQFLDWLPNTTTLLELKARLRTVAATTSCPESRQT